MATQQKKGFATFISRPGEAPGFITETDTSNLIAKAREKKNRIKESTDADEMFEISLEFLEDLATFVDEHFQYSGTAAQMSNFAWIDFVRETWPDFCRVRADRAPTESWFLTWFANLLETPNPIHAGGAAKFFLVNRLGSVKKYLNPKFLIDDPNKESIYTIPKICSRLYKPNDPTAPKKTTTLKTKGRKK